MVLGIIFDGLGSLTWASIYTSFIGSLCAPHVFFSRGGGVHDAWFSFFLLREPLLSSCLGLPNLSEGL